MPSTTFKIGQTVHATLTAQGLTAGQDYVVLAADVRTNFLGTFVTYHVMPKAGGLILPIQNMHFLATPVDNPDAPCARCGRPTIIGLNTGYCSEVCFELDTSNRMAARRADRALIGAVLGEGQAAAEAEADPECMKCDNEGPGHEGEHVYESQV